MKLNNNGFTLVEVMAGFSLLVVLMVSFVKIVKLSSDLTLAAVNSKNSTNEFYKNYYTGENYKINNKVAFRKAKDSDNKVNLDIVINEIKVDSSNGEETVVKSFDLTNREKNKVKLKIIENLNDNSFAKIAVYRYVREK